MTTMTNNQQLELGFNGTQSRILGRRRESRIARGQWWFSQMRAAVTGGGDWQTAVQPPDEQITFTGASRQVKA
jgi:hypothetical protein